MVGELEEHIGVARRPIGAPAGEVSASQLEPNPAGQVGLVQDPFPIQFNGFRPGMVDGVERVDDARAVVAGDDPPGLLAVGGPGDLEWVAP